MTQEAYKTTELELNSPNAVGKAGYELKPNGRRRVLRLQSSREMLEDARGLSHLPDI
jgi:hypothetical protein